MEKKYLKLLSTAYWGYDTSDASVDTPSESDTFNVGRQYTMATLSKLLPDCYTLNAAGMPQPTIQTVGVMYDVFLSGALGFNLELTQSAFNSYISPCPAGSPTDRVGVAAKIQADLANPAPLGSCLKPVVPMYKGTPISISAALIQFTIQPYMALDAAGCKCYKGRLCV